MKPESQGMVFKSEDIYQGGGSVEGKYRPLMQVGGETGCGSTMYQPLSAFSGKEDKNLLSNKIDEDFSSCRTPLEVLSDVMTDKDQLENIPEDVRKRLLTRSEILKDCSPPCSCLPSDSPENGPYYVYLGHAGTKAELRKIFEARLGMTGSAVRMEEVRYTGKEGKTSEDCPIAKWIIKRRDEKILVVCKNRFGHRCQYTWVAVSVVIWEGLSKELADRAYQQLSFETSRFGTETERQCAANKKKTCACQGLDMGFAGASYTFGCSWTMYHNICKFCRSMEVHKFKLNDTGREGLLEGICTDLVDTVAPIFNQYAPDAFNNMCLFEEVASECRIGSEGRGGRPFSGITCVCDFCAHAHKDTNNMIGGSTCVVTLKRPGETEPDDEQYHVLPLYVPDATPQQIDAAVASGGLQVLTKFPRMIAVRETKRALVRRGRIAAERKRMLDTGKDCNLNVEGLPQLDGNSTLTSIDGIDAGLTNLSLEGYSSGDEDDVPNFPGYQSSGQESFNSSGNRSGFMDSSSDAVDELVDNLKLTIHESDCLEAFQDPDIGGIAFSLPHGSILIEVAKQELHATTALKKPDRSQPHRIGLVFYQHKNLHLPGHGAEEYNRKRAIREFRDYVQWLKGNYVPTEAKLKAMSESGFVFPKEVKTVARPMDVANPEDFFKADVSLLKSEAVDSEGVGYDSADRHWNDHTQAFDSKQLLVDGESPIEDEINLLPAWERKSDKLLSLEEEEEVAQLEKELEKEFKKS